MAKILLIEDEPDQIEMIKMRLEAGGYHVITACNGKEGIKLAQEEKPDLILMDMILPGMHGLEATIKLKEIPETKEIPIIALTALGSLDFKQVCYRNGICAFIRKPYESKEFFEKIENHINVNEKEKYINIDDIEKQTKIDKKEYEAEIEREIEEMPKDSLSEYELNPDKKHSLFHDEKKKLEKEEIIEDEEKIEKQKEQEEIVNVNIVEKIKETKKNENKILIVDDNPDLVTTLGIRLRTQGYQVATALDGYSAVSKAHKEIPDLILLDIMMPGGGGYSVFDNLKKSQRTMLIPIIFVSGLLQPKELKEKAKEMGAEDSISKPFESKELIAKIKKFFGE